jgi:hypothetical protein
MAGGVSPVIECLPSKLEALSLNAFLGEASKRKKKEKKKNKLPKASFMATVKSGKVSAVFALSFLITTLLSPLVSGFTTLYS